MNRRKLLVFLVAFTAFLGLGAATMVVNSQDWRDNSLVISYSHFQDEDVRMVTNLGEGQLISDMLEENVTHQLYSSEDEAVWDDYGQFLSNNDVDVQQNSLNWEEDQYNLYSNVQQDVEGFIVVKPGFGFDTISAFSKAIASDYWILYYDEERTTEFLSDKNKPVIFYGEYYTQPWLDLESSDVEIISEGSKAANNKELAKQLFESSGDDSAVVAGDTYIEKGFLKKGNPIILSQNLEDTVSLVEEYNVSIIEVIGAENVNFGNSIKDRLGDSVSVIAKFGRKFTGVEGLQGTYPIKKLPVDAVERSVSLERIDFDRRPDSTDEVRLLFSNTGNVPTQLNFSAVQLENGEQAELVSRPTDVLLRPGTNTSLNFDVNTSFNASQAEVSFDYQGKEGLTTQQYDVTPADLSSNPEVSVDKLYYSERKQQIIMDVSNEGSDNVWVGGQLDNLNILDRTERVLSDEKVRVAPGASSSLVYNVRLTENQTVENSLLNTTVVSGNEKNQSDQHSNFQNVRMEVEETTLTGVFLRSPAAPVAVVLLLVVAVFMLERRRDLVSNSVTRLRELAGQ